MTSLIYIHIGTNLPKYIYDSVYQSLLINNNVKIYILIDDSLIKNSKNVINKFNLSLYKQNYVNLVEYIPLSIFKNEKYILEYNKIKDKIPESTKNFRNNFWISTTERFFYLQSFITLFQIENAYHIENDVMLYKSLNALNTLYLKDLNKLCFVKDNPYRVIASIIYIPNSTCILHLIIFIIEEISKTKNLLNDMQLLGLYTQKYPQNIYSLEYDFSKQEYKYIYDGAAIGQYIDGIDPRNIKDYTNMNDNDKLLLEFDNPTKNFVNETCEFKIDNNYEIFFKKLIFDNIILPIRIPFISYALLNDNINFSLKHIVNLHFHSKQLFKYSSLFDIKYNDIISGDRIISLCDFVITTHDIYNFHKNLDKFININNVIIIKNFNQINYDNLNKIFNEVKPNKKHIKLFIYTHLLKHFNDKILFNLDKKLEYTIYLHNSDHSLEELIDYDRLLNANHIKKIYAQNINCPFNEKFELLPIGLANSMWNHGNMLSLYRIMSETYLFEKTKNLYININTKTFAYRQQILNELEKRQNDFTITKSSKPFNEYLEELSQHYFCLCIRGNGIDCHRTWECYYLGVIPIIINNKFTNMDNHILYMKNLGLPYYEIKQENLDKYSDNFFNKDLYIKLIKKYGYIQNNPALKLSYYS